MRTTRMEMAVEAYDGNGSKIRMEMDGPYGLPYITDSLLLPHTQSSYAGKVTHAHCT